MQYKDILAEAGKIRPDTVSQSVPHQTGTLTV